MPTRILSPTALLLALALLAPALSAQLLVPQQHATIQDAIDQAAPGDVILVTGGSHGPFVIDKPLTIVGADSARPLLRPYDIVEFPEPASYDPPVTLAGPGAGTVTLAGLDIGGELWIEYQDSAPAIGGGGFDELRVLHCDVAAPTWVHQQGNPFWSPGIEVDVDHLLVRDSTVVGGEAGFNGNWWQYDVPNGGEGILTTGDVDVFDSTVRGGDGFDVDFDYAVGAGPNQCSEIVNGEGGPGISTPGAVRHAGSVIQGGAGADLEVTDYSINPSQTTFLCTKPDGAPLLAGGVLALDDSLTGAGALVPLTSWSLQSDSSSTSGALLLVGSRPMAPLPLDGVLALDPGRVAAWGQTPQATVAAGLLYMDPGSFTLLPIATGPTSVSFPIRDIPALYGTTLVVQRHDIGNGLSRPVHATFVGP